MMWADWVIPSKLTALTHRWSLRRALALPPRGGIRNDGLTVKRAYNRLEIEWNARTIHPWDQDEASEIKARKFFEQLLADTEVAIERIFNALPQIDQLDITVRDPDSDQVIVSGTVDRASFGPVRSESARMRLMARGMKCDLDAGYFAQLAAKP
jgi:hypothetical protein